MYIVRCFTCKESWEFNSSTKACAFAEMHVKETSPAKHSVVCYRLTSSDVLQLMKQEYNIEIPLSVTLEFFHKDNLLTVKYQDGYKKVDLSNLEIFKMSGCGC